MKPFIGLKRLWYGPVISRKPDIETINFWIQSANTKEVTNVHDGTWSYSQDDPEITDYINELTTKPYYRDVTSNGNKTIAFTLGEYALTDRVSLLGGSVTSEGIWEAPKTYEVIYKGILAMTKTGNFVLFPRAGVVAKTDTQDKNLGLGVTAVAMDDASTEATEEYWIDGSVATGIVTDKKSSTISTTEYESLSVAEKNLYSDSVSDDGDYLIKTNIFDEVVG